MVVLSVLCLGVECLCCLHIMYIFIYLAKLDFHYMIFISVPGCQFSLFPARFLGWDAGSNRTSS